MFHFYPPPPPVDKVYWGRWSRATSSCVGHHPLFHHEKQGLFLQTRNYIKDNLGIQSNNETQSKYNTTKMWLQQNSLKMVEAPFISLKMVETPLILFVQVYGLLSKACEVGSMDVLRVTVDHFVNIGFTVQELVGGAFELVWEQEHTLNRRDA